MLEKEILEKGFGSSTYLDKELDLTGSTHLEAVQKLTAMQRIRIVENKIAELRRDGQIGGPVHLGAGQEAIAVGISKYLTNSDRIFSAHRSHAHLIALDSSVRGLFAELLGRSTGLTKGMGGSMHLWDEPKGFFGSVPIVGGTVPLAVGAGLAAKMQTTSDIAVAYFGDGAAEEGVVHESLNLASQLKIPVLFICENNLFSSHMHISQRQPLHSVGRFGKANAIETVVLDGNNIIDVELAAQRLISIARIERRPVFIEAITYRHYGHVDWRDDIDVGVNRSGSDLEIWKQRDPIARLINAILMAKIMSYKEIQELFAELELEVSDALNLALQDPYPNEEQMLSTVYYLEKNE